MGRQPPREEAERFSVYLDELAGVVGRVSRVGPMRDYCTGLLLPGERKSVEVPDLFRDRRCDGA